MKFKKDSITAVLQFQHRVLGYNFGYSYDLFSEEAVMIIDYLKSKNFWYSCDDTSDGVELTQKHCDYIISNILKRPILDWDNFEIIIGFLDAYYKNNSENDRYALTAYFKENSNYAFTTFLTNYIVNKLSFFSSKKKLSLNNNDIDELMKVNKVVNGKPLNFDLTKYVFFLEKIDLNDFIIGKEYQRGI